MTAAMTLRYPHRMTVYKTSHLEIAGVHPSRQLVYCFIQPGFVLLYVRGAVWVVQVVNEVLTDLQPAGNVFLQYLLVKIVHVVMFLHWALSAEWPATEAGQREKTAVGGTGCEGPIDILSVIPLMGRETFRSGLRLTGVWSSTWNLFVKRSD